MIHVGFLRLLSRVVFQNQNAKSADYYLGSMRLKLKSVLGVSCLSTRFYIHFMSSRLLQLCSGVLMITITTRSV